MAIATPEEEEEKKQKKKNKSKAKKSMSFGVVSVHEYNRAMGEDGVPVDGEWVLVLEPRIVTQYTLLGSVIDFEKK
eukprot:394311-Ditylum_brightwellii.AAC.1